MTTPDANLILDALSLPKDAIYYSFGQKLREIFPGRFLLESDSVFFRVTTYASEGHCDVETQAGLFAEAPVQYYDREPYIYGDAANAWRSIRWRGLQFDLFTVSVEADYGSKAKHFLVAEDEADAEAFFRACCKWNSEIRGEVLVFNGCWQKDPELFESVRKTSLDTLVLEGGLKETIESDFKSFFDSKELYERHGVPWKRGVLFLGPPGNGKTHAIKGLVNVLGLPCLYVRSFQTMHATQQSMVSEVFQRARQSSPCVLIFEDLDSLINDNVRAFFLNEMDGFAANEGIMTIATTNHPERLDPAILERPSRFDRKYTFNLPDEVSRAEYLTLQNRNLESELKLTDDEIFAIAGLTDDFSFAYLKELVLSSMMKWINGAGSGSMFMVMTTQIDSLRSQMATPAPEMSAEVIDPMAMYMSRWQQAEMQP